MGTKSDIYAVIRFVFILISFVGFVFYLYYFHLFTYTGVQHYIYIRWCSYRLTVTRRVSLVEQELLPLLEYLSTLPVFIWIRIARSLVFCVVFCRSLFVLLFFFFWPLFGLSFSELRIQTVFACISIRTCWSVTYRMKSLWSWPLIIRSNNWLYIIQHCPKGNS